MRIVLAGSRYLGAAALCRLLAAGHQVAAVLVPDAGDRLAVAAARVGLVPVVQEARRPIDRGDVPSADLLIAAHCHARILPGALRAQRFGGIGYHPSLLPRHRGIAAVEWTVRCADPIAGGTVYRLDAGLDTGPVLAQRWCHVLPGETAGDLWRRALCPMGEDLLLEVVSAYAAGLEPVGAFQDDRFATDAPRLGGAVTTARGGDI